MSISSAYSSLIARLCIAVFFAFMLVTLAWCMGGCRTSGIDYDQFPDPVQCRQARDQAIGWYWHKFGRAPVCPPCEVTHEAKPRSGMAGWTTKSGIHIWVGQLQDETHEWRHWLCIWSNDDSSEEIVR